MWTVRPLTLYNVRTFATTASSVSAAERALAPAVVAPLRGTHDLFASGFTTSEDYRYIEQGMINRCRTHHFSEIRTPVIERASLFHRTLGLSSDVVSKEMFQFQDATEFVCLRPENTAGMHLFACRVLVSCSNGQIKLLQVKYGVSGFRFISFWNRRDASSAEYTVEQAYGVAAGVLSWADVQERETTTRSLQTVSTGNSITTPVHSNGHCF